MVLYRLPILILLMSLLYLFIIPEEPATFKFVFKFVPLILILLHAFRLMPKRKKAAHFLILTGLLLSFIGEMTSLTMIISMILYAVVLILYTSGFLSAKENKRFVSIPVIIPLLAYIGVMINFLTRDGNQIASAEYLLYTAMMYIVLLALTVWAAFVNKNLFAIVGSLLFAVAHTILLWHNLIQPIEYATEIVFSAYIGAQFCIATSLDNIIPGAKSIVW